jgi:hypothetical protein
VPPSDETGTVSAAPVSDPGPVVAGHRAGAHDMSVVRAVLYGVGCNASAHPFIWGAIGLTGGIFLPHIGGYIWLYAWAFVWFAGLGTVSRLDPGRLGVRERSGSRRGSRLVRGNVDPPGR